MSNRLELGHQTYKNYSAEGLKVRGGVNMECPLSYETVIKKGKLVLKYFSETMNGSCCWYALKEDQTSFEILTSADKQEIIAFYQDGQLVYLNKNLLKAPSLIKRFDNLSVEEFIS